MSSRMHSPYTTCPGCNEVVYLEELVSGRCPLCGFTLDDIDNGINSLEDFCERADLTWLVYNYFLFKRFDELGVIPPQVFELLLSHLRQTHEQGTEPHKLKFRFEIPLTWLEKIKLKKCEICKRKFFRSGKKWVSGSMENSSFSTSFTCKTCSSIAPSDNSSLARSSTSNTDSC